MKVGKVVFLSCLVMLSLCVVKTQPVVAIETVYIRNDGSIEGDGLTFENEVYTFTGDIYGQIIIEKDGVTVDGSGHVLHGINDNGLFLK